MANGKQHAQAVQLAAVPVGILTWAITGELEAAAAVTIGVLVGLIIDPDLDMVQPTRSEWQMVATFGVLGKAWRWFWYPYAWLVPHRSWISHKPLIGTAIRVSYVILPVMVAWPPLAGYLASKYFLFGFIGLATADIIHWIMDGLP